MKSKECRLAVALVLFSLLAFPIAGMADDVLYLYGPGGPAPAMKEAAEAFGKANNIRLEVTAGPTGQWLAKAKADAQAIYDELKPLVGQPAALLTQFEAIAKAKSNDTGSASSGGELPYFTRDQVDRGFGDAIFNGNLKAGDLIGPVLSQYGYHIILFEDRRPDPESRIQNAKVAVDSGQDFATVAKSASEGAEASKGGDLGWIARLQLEKKLEDAIFNTPVGKTSDVVDGTSVDASGNVGGGWYLFKVVDEQTRKPDGDQVTQLKANAFTNWYTAQKDAATIVRSQNLPTVTQ